MEDQYPAIWVIQRFHLYAETKFVEYPALNSGGRMECARADNLARRRIGNAKVSTCRHLHLLMQHSAETTWYCRIGFSLL